MKWTFFVARASWSTRLCSFATFLLHPSNCDVRAKQQQQQSDRLRTVALLLVHWFYCRIHTGPPHRAPLLSGFCLNNSSAYNFIHRHCHCFFTSENDLRIFSLSPSLRDGSEIFFSNKIFFPLPFCLCSHKSRKQSESGFFYCKQCFVIYK